jgi:hypothetical protein
MVDCPARSLTLTSSSCVADFKRASDKRPQPWESRWHCSGCPLGRERSGGGSSRPPFPSGLCVRCHRVGMRIVTKEGLCVSCYNRQKELVEGRNGKGGFPTVTRARYQFHARAISVGDDGSRMYREGPRHCASLMEGMLTTLRVSHTVRYFGRAAGEAGDQESFWGGA